MMQDFPEADTTSAFQTEINGKTIEIKIRCQEPSEDAGILREEEKIRDQLWQIFTSL